MEITDVRIHINDKADSKVKAIASITIDGCFVVHEIRIIDNGEKVFLNMPSRKTPEGEFKDIAHALNNETRDMIFTAVKEAYAKLLTKLEQN